MGILRSKPLEYTLPTMSDDRTIFEKIVAREIPADIVHEDDTTLAFLDINPVQHGHLLVITKKPYPWIQDVPDNEVAHAFVVAKNLIPKLKAATNCDYVRVSVVGKDVPHFPIHLIPAWLGKPPRPDHTPYDSAKEKESVLTKLTKTQG